MGGKSSKEEMEEFRDEISRVLRRMADDQDSQTNSAMRAQYNRITDLMNQLSERLTDRHDASQERLERQVRELQEQLEIVQKKASNDRATSSGDRMNDILRDIRNALGASLSVKDQNNSGGFPQKMPNQPYQNSSWPMGQPDFGPVSQRNNYGAHQYSQQGYRGPYGPNPNMSYAPNPNTPPFSGPPFPPNYQVRQPLYQQPNPSPHPSTYFPPNSSHPPATMPMSRVPRNENPKLEKATKKFSKTSSEDSMKKKSAVPEVKNVIKDSQKSSEANIVNITKRFAEVHKNVSKTSQETKPIKLEDIENIIAKFKQQQIDNARDDGKPTGNINAAHKSNDRFQKHEGIEKRDERDSKRFESGEYRRGQYKARGRGRANHQQWRNKNRQPREKVNYRNFNNDESDSDSNESVTSNVSCASRTNTAFTEKNKKVFWTTLPNYARDYNFERTKSKIDVMAKNLDLKNYKSEIDSDNEVLNVTLPCQPMSRKKDESEAKENRNNEKPRIETKTSGRDENGNSKKQGTSKSSNLKKINYPSEEQALNESLDIQKPLEKPVLFIGLTETGEHHTHKPKCLADIYKLEKIYESRELISLG